jgi:superfamily II DNA or RNA helicase
LKPVDNQIKITMLNHSTMHVDADRGIQQELSEHFSFFVEGYKFMPTYRNRVWDGKIRLFNLLTSELPVGLYLDVAKLAQTRGYPIILVDTVYGMPLRRDFVDAETVTDFTRSIDLPYPAYDYQLAAIHHIAMFKRGILLSPTGSGKSLMIYALMRWYMKHETGDILIVVPTTGLVEQMQGDFEDYGFSRDNIHTIYSGKDKNTDKRIILSTWQSIYKLSPVWFKRFGCIFGDECHGFAAKSLSSIMNKSHNAQYRIGTTGTLDGTKTHEMVLKALYGPVMNVTTTKKLQDQGTLAALDIDIIQLNYPKHVRESWGKKKYQDEIKFITQYEPRNKFISNLSVGLKGNTLVLFRLVDHGKVLFDLTKPLIDPNRKMYYIHGGVGTSDRDAVRHIVEKQDDAIIYASMGTFSTGINIRNIHNIVFASPSKGQIKVLQSIGRGLRLADNGTTTKLYDIVDDARHMGYNNFAVKHSGVRIKIYENQLFKFKLHGVDLHE